MADVIIYRLALRLQSKHRSSREASSDYQDLRQIVGHADKLDYLTAKLIDLGYERDADDAYLDEAVASQNDLFLEHSDFNDQSFSAREEDQGSASSEDSGRSEDWDGGNESISDSAESFEGGDDDGGPYSEYVYASTHSSNAYSSKGAIQAFVQEMVEFQRGEVICKLIHPR